MPLQEHVPQIDARRYDDIVKELRNRIPRYVPEWTDFNDSDPGMTLVQLFAWLADMLLYRMNRVPELNQVKFLQLLGMELRPAEPARAEITFPLNDTVGEDKLIIPKGTQIAAESESDERPLVFETEQAFNALAARLDKVQIIDRGGSSDVNAMLTEPGQAFDPFGAKAVIDNALKLGFKYAEENFPEKAKIDLTVWTDEAVPDAPACDCGLEGKNVFRATDIAWEYQDKGEWRSLTQLKDETYGFTRSGHIVLKSPANWKKEKPDELFWIRARVVKSISERRPKVYAIRTNTVPVVQALTISDEVLGDSDGSPHQVFRLASAPVVHGSLKLEVFEEDLQYHAWEPVEDLFSSKKDSSHYLLNRATGEVRFGDGTNGRIPPGVPESGGAGIVATEYRYGGGKRGNVGAGQIKTLMSTLNWINANGVANLKPAFGGRDEETLEDAKKRVPQSLKSRCRAVTTDDFEEIAKQAATIKRAKALPLYHPDFPGVKVPGVVTVIVIPDSDEKAPVPSEGTLRTVCEYLNQRRLLTTELYVVKPTYQEVKIKADVVVNDNADLADVKDRILSSLDDYFHPLKGGEDGAGWPFGGDIYFSKVYQRIFSIPGVKRVETVKILMNGEESECKDVRICDGVLPYSGEHEVEVDYSSDL